MVQWSQHTSNLQEGNAAVCCIPANSRLRSAAASIGPMPPALLLKQITMAAESALQPNNKKKRTIPLRTPLYHLWILLLGHCAYQCALVAAELQCARRSAACGAASRSSADCISSARLSSAQCACQRVGLTLL